MAKLQQLRFGTGLFYIGDGATPEVFSKLCGVKSLTLTYSKETNEYVVPDCDDDEAVSWKEADVVSLGWSASVEGLASAANLAKIEAATLSPISRNIRVYIKGAGSGGATPDRMYAGKAHINHDISGEDKGVVSLKIDISGDGALVPSSVAMPV